MGIICLTGGIINIISITTIIRIIILQPLLLQVLQPSLLLSEVLLLLCLNQCLQKFINKTLQGGKRLLFNSDPWPSVEQKLEMPCDIYDCGNLSRSKAVNMVKGRKGAFIFE